MGLPVPRAATNASTKSYIPGYAPDVGRLLTGSDIGEKLGVSHQRAFQIVEKTDFPRPVAREGRSRLWRAGDVELWVRHSRWWSERPWR
jgi:predicted DNA-binding transcriptional regulator AlpA